MCYGTEPDLQDHDPHGINSHIKIQFHDVLAEPDEFHSCRCVWDSVDCCYNFTFPLCYGLPVALCHLCVALGWGIEFGQLLFWHVWCVGPFTSFLRHLLHVPATCLRLCTRCLLDPCCEACSYVFMFCREPPSAAVAKGKDRSDWDPMTFL
ncbi:caveolin-2-like [Babylonia areolata]|uniref:caveolin-2-like n=1 Tax=Babylonia areolata TaxID=304850 RepID=UPI003FD0A678